MPLLDEDLALLSDQLAATMLKGKYDKNQTLKNEDVNPISSTPDASAQVYGPAPRYFNHERDGLPAETTIKGQGDNTTTYFDAEFDGIKKTVTPDYLADKHHNDNIALQPLRIGGVEVQADKATPELLLPYLEKFPTLRDVEFTDQHNRSIIVRKNGSLVGFIQYNMESKDILLKVVNPNYTEIGIDGWLEDYANNQMDVSEKSDTDGDGNDDTRDLDPEGYDNMGYTVVKRDGMVSFTQKTGLDDQDVNSNAERNAGEDPEDNLEPSDFNDDNAEDAEDIAKTESSDLLADDLDGNW